MCTVSKPCFCVEDEPKGNSILLLSAVCPYYSRNLVPLIKEVMSLEFSVLTIQCFTIQGI